MTAFILIEVINIMVLKINIYPLTNQIVPFGVYSAN